MCYPRSGYPLEPNLVGREAPHAQGKKQPSSLTSILRSMRFRITNKNHGKQMHKTSLINFIHHLKWRGRCGKHDRKVIATWFSRILCMKHIQTQRHLSQYSVPRLKLRWMIPTCRWSVSNQMCQALHIHLRKLLTIGTRKPNRFFWGSIGGMVS